MSSPIFPSLDDIYCSIEPSFGVKITLGKSDVQYGSVVLVSSHFFPPPHLLSLPCFTCTTVRMAKKSVISYDRYTLTLHLLSHRAEWCEQTYGASDQNARSKRGDMKRTLWNANARHRFSLINLFCAFFC